jgi:hypothetical protein
MRLLTFRDSIVNGNLRKNIIDCHARLPDPGIIGKMVGMA